MKEKKDKAPKGKVAIKTADAVNAFILLNQQKKEAGSVTGVKLSALETADIFKVLYIIKALKPIATAYEDFRKDVEKQFEPENWNERASKYEESSDEEKTKLDKELSEYRRKVDQCLEAELNKEKEIEAYERLDKEVFGLLVKDNGHILFTPQISILMDVLV